MVSELKEMLKKVNHMLHHRQKRPARGRHHREKLCEIEMLNEDSWFVIFSHLNLRNAFPIGLTCHWLHHLANGHMPTLLASAFQNASSHYQCAFAFKDIEHALEWSPTALKARLMDAITGVLSGNDFTFKASCVTRHEMLLQLLSTSTVSALLNRAHLCAILARLDRIKRRKDFHLIVLGMDVLHASAFPYVRHLMRGIERLSQALKELAGCDCERCMIQNETVEVHLEDIKLEKKELLRQMGVCGLMSASELLTEIARYMDRCGSSWKLPQMRDLLDDLDCASSGLVVNAVSRMCISTSPHIRMMGHVLGGTIQTRPCDYSENSSHNGEDELDSTDDEGEEEEDNIVGVLKEEAAMPIAEALANMQDGKSTSGMIAQQLNEWNDLVAAHVTAYVPKGNGPTPRALFALFWASERDWLAEQESHLLIRTRDMARELRRLS